MEKYIKASDFYEWKCSESHDFKMRWDNIKIGGNWCGECRRDTIQILQKHAFEKGGN